MKLYIDTRQNGDTLEKGITVYSNEGLELYSDIGKIREENLQKFDKTLIALSWGLKKYRLLCQNGQLKESEDLLLFINNQTIYDWLEKENSPKQYLDKLLDVLTELSLIVAEVEVIYSENKRVLYNKAEKDNLKLSDVFKGR